jgi:hypothetical protein
VQVRPPDSRRYSLSPRQLVAPQLDLLPLYFGLFENPLQNSLPEANKTLMFFVDRSRV